MNNDDPPTAIRKQAPRTRNDSTPNRHKKGPRTPGWMGDVNGPGCDPDVGGDDPEQDDLTPAPAPPPKSLSEQEVRKAHKDLLTVSQKAIRTAREGAVSQGLHPLNLVGFAWDLRDPLLPYPLQISPMVKQAIRSSKPNQSLIHTGVFTKEEIITLITPLAYKLEKREPPLIISAHHKLPGLVCTIQDWNQQDSILVIVLCAKNVSMHALPVDLVVSAPSDALPPAKSQPPTA
jgi:hypothetical protein